MLFLKSKRVLGALFAGALSGLLSTTVLAQATGDGADAVRNALGKARG